MPVPILDLQQQHQALLGELSAAFEKATAEAAFVLGPAVSEFETNFAKQSQCSYCIGMSSGTDAILAALMALDIGPGDEVITTPFTFFATAGCIARTGARPVFVDIDPETYNINPTLVASAITDRTKAIMPVHLYGLSANMTAIVNIAREHNLAVIEDAAQAVGATHQGKKVGSFGQIGAFSFYPTKNLSALGDAGACTTHDGELDIRLRKVRLHGMEGGYLHECIGGNFRIDAIQASFLDIKLRYLEKWTAARRAVAARYGAAFSGIPLMLPGETPGDKHVYHQYTVRIGDGRRDDFSAYLTSRGIGNRVYYPLPLHLQPCFSYLGHQPGDFAESERAAAEVLSLPMYAELTEAQIDEVIDAVKGYFKP